MNPVVIIPTIYASKRASHNDNPFAVYDHPSQVGHADELRRCLQSLRYVRDLGRIMIVVGTGEGQTGAGFKDKPNWQENKK